MGARLLVVLALLGTTLSAVPAAAEILAEDQDTLPPASGVVSTSLVGRVVLGLRCPVPIADDGGDCAPDPFPASLVVRSADGQVEVARVATDPGGAFTIPLDPGTYLVDVPAAAATPWVTHALRVTIGSDGPTALVIRVPTGSQS